MRGLRVLILVCAAVSAMGAMWMMRSALQSQANLPAPAAVAVKQPVNETIQAPETVEVLVAARQVSTGRRLTLEDIRWQNWPAEAVSDQFYTRSEDPEAIATLEGAAARLTIVEGEPVTENKIVDLHGSGVMASLLRPGMRAVSLPISEITGAGGFILPGDFVDLLITRQISVEQINEESGEVERTTTHHQTDVIMETVRVLAIDQQLNEAGKASALGNSATLELQPDQVELLTLTRQISQQSRGFITLSLRSFAEMLDEYGEDVDKVLPRTVLDLREIAEEEIAAAELSRKKYADYIREKKRLEENPEEAAVVAEIEAAETKTDNSTITLIRNGAPIVVHTIAPTEAGVQ